MTPPRRVPPFFRAITRAMLATLWAIFHIILQSVLSIFGFLVVWALTLLSVGMLPLCGAGIPVLALLFMVVDGLANIDIALVSWFSRCSTQRPARSTPDCPSIRGLQDWLSANCTDRDMWRSWFFFAIVKLPLELPASIISLGWFLFSAMLISSPIGFILGVQQTTNMCLVRLVSEAAACYESETFWMSASLAISGIVLFPPGAFCAVALANFSIRVVRWWHGAVVNEQSEALSSSNLNLEPSMNYFNSTIVRPVAATPFTQSFPVPPVSSRHGPITAGTKTF